MQRSKETIREEYVKCGKKKCKSCPHGPYFYAYWRENGKLKKKYLGKQLPKSEPEQAVPKKVHPWDAIFNRTTATLLLACEILGVSTSADREEVRKRFWYLAKKHHPDRGGDAEAFKHTSGAWEYIRQAKGWR